jgi:hypothetical protein
MPLALPMDLPISRPDRIRRIQFLQRAQAMKRRGVEMKIMLEGDKTLIRVDPSASQGGRAGSKMVRRLFAGRVQSFDALAKREGLDKRSVRRLIRLGSLSPRIVEAIVVGRQSPELTVIGLTRRLDLPMLWSAQEQALGIRYFTHADEDSRAHKSRILESPLHDQKRFCRNPDVQRLIGPR